jgi:hypothetical protein
MKLRSCCGSRHLHKDLQSFAVSVEILRRISDFVQSRLPITILCSFFFGFCGDVAKNFSSCGVKKAYDLLLLRRLLPQYLVLHSWMSRGRQVLHLPEILRWKPLFVVFAFVYSTAAAAAFLCMRTFQVQTKMICKVGEF